MRKGGISDPRNKILMKMFNLINIGERAGKVVFQMFLILGQIRGGLSQSIKKN